jgi:hypothetical protein
VSLFEFARLVVNQSSGTATPDCLFECTCLSKPSNQRMDHGHTPPKKRTSFQYYPERCSVFFSFVFLLALLFSF